jgi:hypothetical protein
MNMSEFVDVVYNNLSGEMNVSDKTFKFKSLNLNDNTIRIDKNPSIYGRMAINQYDGGVYLASGGTSWTSASDERLKNITGEIENGLSKVCSLRAAKYTWKSDESAKAQVGLIAQDVLAVLPEAVDVPIEGSIEKDGSPARMGVQYNSVIPLLVKAIQELKAEVDLLKQQINGA